MTISKVFMICNAYESGYGHGYEQDKLCNPFGLGTDECEAYSLGYHVGFGERGEAKSTRKETFCKCKKPEPKGFLLPYTTCKNCGKDIKNF